jgi:hypothetical protein
MGTTEAVRDRHLAHGRVEYPANHHRRVAAIALSTFIVAFELPIRLIDAMIRLSPREQRLVFGGTALFWRNLVRLWRDISVREA